MGEWSAPLTVDFPAAPLPPANLRVAVNDGLSINVVWDAPSADPSVTCFYEVSRDGLWATSTYDAHYVDPGIVAGVTYTYTVRMLWIVQDPSVGMLVLSAPPTAGLAVKVPLPGENVGAVAGLRTAALKGSSTRLVWDEAANAAGYAVFRDGQAAGQPATELFDDTGRIPGAAHAYIVYALSASGAPGGAGGPLTVAFPGPATPTGFRVDAAAPGAVALAWDAPADDSFTAHYEVHRDGAFLAATDAAVFVDETTVTGESYVYTLRARWDFNDAGGGPATLYSPLTAGLDVTAPDAPPPAVTGLAAVFVKGSSARLAWDAAAGAAAYEIRRDGQEPAAGTVAAPATVFDDTGRIPGTSHVYAVRALSASDAAGAWSEPLTVTFPGPATPTDFRVTANADGVVRLAWDVLTDDSFPARYEIRRDDAPLGTTDAAAFADEAVAAGTTHVYKLRARWEFVGADGGPAVLYSAFTPTLVVDAPSNLPPVTGLAADSLRGSSARLGWDAFAGAVSYQLRRDGAVAANPTAAFFTDTGRFPQNVHSYSVRAALADGSFSAWSAACQVEFPGPRPPGALTLVDNEQGPIRLAWSAPGDDSFPAVYEIFRDGSSLARTSATEYGDEAVDAGTVYGYRVRTRWDFNDPATGAKSLVSDFTDALAVEALAPIPPVTGLAADSVLGASARLSWDVLAGAAGYRVRRDGVDIVDVPEAFFVDTGRIPETWHTYTVKAVMPGGRLSADWSAPCRVDFPGPRPPSNLRAAADADAQAIRLVWDAPDDLSLAPHYEIHQDGEWKVDAAAAEYPDNAVLPGGAYSYMVRVRWDFVDPVAGEKSLYSTFTNEATAEAPPLAVTVTGLRASEITPMGARIEWDRLGGAGHYQLRRDGVLVVESGSGAVFVETGRWAPATHDYTVRALLPNGSYTDWSEPLPVVYAEPPPMAAPRLVENAAGRVTIAWDPPTNLGGFFLPYIVNEDDYYGGYQDIHYNASEGDFTKFEPGATLRLVVEIYYGGGYDGYNDRVLRSEPLIVATLPPPAPELRLFYTTPAEVGLNWSFPPHPDNGYYYYEDTCDYELYRDDGQTPVATGRGYPPPFVDATGVAGETYVYRIRARTYYGCYSGFSAPLTVTFAAAAAPALRAERVGDTYVELAWDAEFSDGDFIEDFNRRFTIYRDDVPVAQNLTGNSWRDDGRTPGTTHSYRIVMRYGRDNNPYFTDSSAAVVVTTRLVAAPALWIVSRTGNTVGLGWNALANTGYVPEYDIEANGAVVKTTIAASWTDDYLTPGEERNYRVRVRLTEELVSEWSDPRGAVTLLPQIPDVFSSANGYSATLRLAYPRPLSVSDTGFPVVYEIERDGVPHGTLLAPTTSSESDSWTDSGLASGVTHVYRARSRFYPGCESPWSLPVTVTTAVPNIPSLSLRAQRANALELVWTDQTGSGYNMDYELLRDGVPIATTRGGVYLDTGLLPGRAYVYRIRSRLYPGRESAWSAPFTALTLYPEPPANFRVAGVKAWEVNLAWKAVDAAATGYEAQYRIEADDEPVAVGGAVNWTHGGLVAGTTHRYRARTRFFLGAESAWSAPLSATTPAPAPPRCTIGTATGGSLQLSLAENPASGHPDVKIEVRRDGVSVALVAPGKWTDTGLSPGTTYSYTARVVWAGGADSAWSSPVTGTTRAPEAPTVTVGERTPFAVTLDWSDKFVTGLASEYDIERDGVVVHTTTAKTWTDGGMAPGTAVSYRLRTRFPGGMESAWSAAVAATTVAPPVPALSVWSNGPPGVNLSWNCGRLPGIFPEYDIRRDGQIIAVAQGVNNNGNLGGSWQGAGCYPGNSYVFEVRSRLFAGCESAWSAPVTHTVAPLDAPRVTVHQVGPQSVRIGAALRASYSSDTRTLEVERDGVTAGTVADINYFDDTGLEPGRVYRYRLRYHLDDWGITPWSDVVEVTTPSPLPPALYADQITTTSLRLYWSDPIDSGYATRVFVIYRDGVPVHTTADTSWTDTGRTPGATYLYQALTRWFPGCESALGGSRKVTMPQPSVPTPTNFRRTGIDWGAVHLAWNAVASESGSVVYEIQRNGLPLAVVAAGKTYVDRDVAAGASYSYKLNARDPVNNVASAKTADVVATLPAPGTGSGLRGRYYADENFVERLLERLDADLASGPAADAPGGTFAVRWEGAIQGPLADDFTLRFETTGGLRVWVDGQLRIDRWSHTGALDVFTTANLRPSRRNSLLIEWRDGARGRPFRFSWSSAVFLAGTVPSPQLYPLNLIGPGGLGAYTSGESRTSPAWVEGEAPAGTAEVVYRLDDGDWVAADRHEDGNWHIDESSATAGLPMGVVLAPGAGRAVRVDAVDGGGVVTSWERTLVWTPTPLDGLSLDDDIIYIRRGDSLLWTVGDAEATPGASVVVRANLMDDRAGVAGAAIPIRYDLAGRYAVRGILNGVEVGAAALVVVDIPRRGNAIAMRPREARWREVRVDPADAWDAVTPTTDEPSLARLHDTWWGGGNQLRLSVQAEGDVVGTSRVFLRVNGLEGPVVAERWVRVVAIGLVTGGSLPRLHRYSDGRMIIGAAVRMTPFFPDVPVRFDGLHGEVLFDGVGGTTQEVIGRDFDENGQFNYFLVTTGGNCHRIYIPDLDDQ